MNLLKSNPLLMAAITLSIGFGLGRISPSSTEAINEVVEHPSASPTHSPSSRSSSSLLSHLSLNEVRSHLDQLANDPADGRKAADLKVLLAEWAKRDPESALAFANERRREDWLHDCLIIYGSDQPDAALQWVEAHITSLGLQAHLTAAVYRGWVQTDATAAIHRIEQQKAGVQRDRLLYLAIDEWAQQDVESVFDWIAEQEITPFLSAAYNQALGRYIEQSPADAAYLVSEMENNADKPNFANQTAFHLAKEEPARALEWAEDLPDQARQFALMGVMESWASGANGLQALDYAKELPKGENEEQLFTMVAMKLAHANPAALSQELPDLNEAQQRIAATQLAQVYSAYDSGQTTRWLASLDHGPVRDAAVKTCLNFFRHSDIQQAFELSETFSEESLRRFEIQQILLAWLPIDPQAASDALMSTDALPESRKLMIRDELARQAPAAKDFLLPAKSQ
ncbi:MAG: hypothetical protein Q7Q71_11120 [Verrucomicrobiota bacterium JB023]|nr:hypothetical protein [Verrucomicrobiota bacterium JB023]